MLDIFFQPLILTLREIGFHGTGVRMRFLNDFYVMMSFQRWNKKMYKKLASPYIFSNKLFQFVLKDKPTIPL